MVGARAHNAINAKSPAVTATAKRKLSLYVLNGKTLDIFNSILDRPEGYKLKAR